MFANVAAALWLAQTAASAAVVCVDNLDIEFAVLRGTWATGTFGTPWGMNYRWCSVTAGTATAEVEWRPALPAAGVYEVAVWYVAGANRATDAPFTIDHMFGSDTVRLNQQIAGSRWIVLGRYPFSAGLSGRVRLGNSAGPGGAVVVADAVRFRSLGSDLDLDGDVDGIDFGSLAQCLNGSGNPIPPGCEDTDLDNDGDVDGADYSILAGCFNGSGSRPACPPLDPIPARRPGAVSGSQFIAEITNLSLVRREERILHEISQGNLPEFLRGFCAVNVSIGGGAHTGTYYVMPDYLAVGSDADFARMPMTPATAQQIADIFQCILPTRKMVNDIYAQAGVKLAPYPFSPDLYDITSVAVFYQHHLAVEQQRAGNPLGLLVGGIKKDVVVTNLLIGRPDRVAIYGWHRLDGTPIQPLYVGHTNTWVDYSHGIRLVRQTMRVDGAERRVADVLSDAALCPLLSDEGPIANPRY